MSAVQFLDCYLSLYDIPLKFKEIPVISDATNLAVAQLPISRLSCYHSRLMLFLLKFS